MSLGEVSSAAVSSTWGLFLKSEVEGSLAGESIEAALPPGGWDRRWGCLPCVDPFAGFFGGADEEDDDGGLGEVAAGFDTATSPRFPAKVTGEGWEDWEDWEGSIS